MRVHELAKEYNIKSTDFVDIVQSFGIGIKSHLNSLDDAQVSDIRFKMGMKDHTKEAELLSKEEIEELNPLGNLTEASGLKPTAHENRERLEPVDEETVVTDFEVVRDELNKAQVKTENLEAGIKESLVEIEKSNSPDPLIDEGDPAPASSVVDKESTGEWNERRAKEIAEEKERVINRENEAENIRRHADLYKRAQIVKMERSGFWGWLKGFFG